MARLLLGSIGAVNEVEDGLVGRLRVVIGVEQERAAGGAPGNAVVDAPKCDHLDRFIMLQEGPEKSGVGVGQLLVCITDQSALGGGRIGGHIGSSVALAALRAIDVKFCNVDGQTEGLQLS